MKRKRKNYKNEEHDSSTSISNKNVFNSFKQSLEEFADLLNTVENNKEKDATYKSPCKKKICTRKSLRNSVIIINDSENELNEKDTADNSVCIIESSPNTRRTSLRSQSLLGQQTRQLKKTSNPRTRSSVILLDDDSPSTSSAIQKSSLEEKDINGENIANLRAEDDVVEVWSCMGRSNINKEESKEYKDSQTGKNAFTIDVKPDLKNLDYIKIDKSPVRKERKKWRYHKDLPIKKLNTHEMRRKLLHKGQKTYKQSSTYISKNQNKKSEKENSDRKHKLREIIIDGCNVAMAHMNGQKFSEEGIKLMVNYFESRGHVVKVFLPQHVRAKRYQLLEEMYTKGIVVFTPSRNIAGKQITPYDDRYILEYATKCEGIVISSDQYRDLYRENPEWRDTILNRLLTPTFVGDYIMFPIDPLGKSGPDLETFLKH
ncbi:uncharacterized protein LOC116845587 isoform X3 [Odontomachus brunneus]|nr:uncharacterized protein LOC116845587 isoform X3 [Odontomachus brunneus]XP_032674320.1 uncharacterized protein LOC116845587 isoform X3 [Odontomachus brunneus]